MFAALGRDIGEAAADAALRAFLESLLQQGLVIADRYELKLDHVPVAVMRTRRMAGEHDYKCAWGVARTFMRGGEPRE